MEFAVSQATVGGGGAAQGQLLSIVAFANVVGSAIGGVVITAYGYTLGFVIAGVLSMFAIPIFSRIDMMQT